MSHPATHIIARQSFLFRLPAEVDPGDVQRLCNEELPTRLNELFDNFCEPDTVLRLKNLDIRLELDPADFSLKTIGIKLNSAVRIALQKQMDDGGTPPKSSVTFTIDGLVYYLEDGFLPWWADSDTNRSLSDRLERLSPNEVGMFAERLKTAALRSHAAFERLIELMAADESIVWHVQRWCDVPEALALGLLAFLRTTWQHLRSGDTEVSFRRKVSAALVSGVPYREATRQERLIRFLRAAGSQGFIPTTGSKLIDVSEILSQTVGSELERSAIASALRALEAASEPARGARSGGDSFLQDQRSVAATIIPDNAPGTSASTADDDRIRVGNAGLVIIALYLGRFFETCGVADGAALADPARAVSLMRYCTYQHIDCFEHQLVLEKILCGMDPAWSPGMLPQLSEADKAECEAMLNAVIANWTVLKQTSAEGLRESFLQRDGLLQRKDAGWQLRVQGQAHDILLDFIPWSISIVRTPWMPDLLFVDWSK